MPWRMVSRLNTIKMKGAFANRVAALFAATSTALGLVIDETWTKPPSRILQWQATSDAGPIVDLEYARYQGYYNPTFDLNIFRGYVRRVSLVHR